MVNVNINMVSCLQSKLNMNTTKIVDKTHTNGYLHMYVHMQSITQYIVYCS